MKRVERHWYPLADGSPLAQRALARAAKKPVPLDPLTGPKLALAVLSGIEAADLVHAVQRGDVARLTRIPGVGKKTAERICLELKDRLPVVEPDGQPTTPPPADALRDDLVSALVNLGYHRSAVDKVLDRQLSDDDPPPFDAALRSALKDLARS